MAPFMIKYLVLSVCLQYIKNIVLVPVFLYDSPQKACQSL